MSEVCPFRIEIPESALQDLRRRLAATRLPERQTVSDWSQGAPLAFMQDVLTHWRDKYDWRRCEHTLNNLGQFTTEIDGLNIHFMHVRSPHENALPLIMTHGWPGSIIEFLKVIAPLTNPTAYGGDASQAFHVVCPSLPGYGFSERPETTGWDLSRTAKAWAELMLRLGYKNYVAQGGDWGAMVTDTMGAQAPAGLKAIHLNMVIAFPGAEDMTNMTPQEGAALAALQQFREQGSAYQQLQSTRPQTLAYALTDSPIGQAAWILEKIFAWSDNDGDPRSVLTLDEMLDNVMLYWLTASGGSSARLYWETSRNLPVATQTVEVPTGCTIFPKELMRPSRRWAERRLKNITYWNEVTRGGHFAAFEQPEIFVNELRAAFAAHR